MFPIAQADLSALLSSMQVETMARYIGPWATVCVVVIVMAVRKVPPFHDRPSPSPAPPSPEPPVVVGAITASELEDKLQPIRDSLAALGTVDATAEGKHETLSARVEAADKAIARLQGELDEAERKADRALSAAGAARGRADLAAQAGEVAVKAIDDIAAQVREIRGRLP